MLRASGLDRNGHWGVELLPRTTTTNPHTCLRSKCEPRIIAQIVIYETHLDVQALLQILDHYYSS